MGIRIVERIRTTPGEARARLVAGLRASPASIPPRYFYDALGCALYGAICTLPEYYPTRTEAAIFDTHRDAIAAAIARGGQWVDLGAGDGAKSERWLDVVGTSRYVAVDAARDALETTLARLSARFPAIEMTGVVADFDEGLDLGDVLRACPGHVLLSRLVDRQLRAAGRDRVPASDRGMVCRTAGQRPPDRRGHAQGPGATRRCLRRRARRHRTLQSQRAVARQSPARHGVRRPRLRSRRLLRRGLGPHRDAPRGAPCRGRGDRRRAAALREGRAHSHGELVQVSARGVRPAARRRRLRAPPRVPRSGPATSPCSTPADTRRPCCVARRSCGPPGTTGSRTARAPCGRPGRRSRACRHRATCRRRPRRRCPRTRRSTCRGPRRCP